MVSTLVVGSNTYVTEAEANTRLENSPRAFAKWGSKGLDVKSRLLIAAFLQLEKQRYLGEKTPVQVVDTVVIAVAGTGYAVDDEVNVVGGTFGVAARIKVTAVTGGVPDTIQLINVGTYSVVPTSPAATLGAGGDDLTVTLVFKAQLTLQPRSGLTDCDDENVDELLVAQGIKDGQIELAFEMSVDKDLETDEDQGSNIKSAGGGSAKVEFFNPTNRPGEAGRFPPIVQELVGCFLAGASGVTTPVAGGSEVTSAFDDDDRYNLDDGFA